MTQKGFQVIAKCWNNLCSLINVWNIIGENFLHNFDVSNLENELNNLFPGRKQTKKQQIAVLSIECFRVHIIYVFYTSSEYSQFYFFESFKM